MFSHAVTQFLERFTRTNCALAKDALSSKFTKVQALLLALGSTTTQARMEVWVWVQGHQFGTLLSTLTRIRRHTLLNYPTNSALGLDSQSHSVETLSLSPQTTLVTKTTLTTWTSERQRMDSTLRHNSDLGK